MYFRLIIPYRGPYFSIIKVLVTVAISRKYIVFFQVFSCQYLHMTAGSLFHFHMQHHQLKSYHTYEKKRQNTKEEEYAKCTISECILYFSFNWVQHTDT